MRYAPNANFAWYNQLVKIIDGGEIRVPRGKKTYDLSPSNLLVNMQQPVVTTAARRLSYQFMAAEAYWILRGDDSVAGIEPWNKHIAQFSDDGERFFGAYGPKIVDQLPYVVNKLLTDPSTRQAGLTIWRESPGETKDYPCTIAMWFGLRGLALDMFVFMRSSDVWLGLPYDIFNFSMVAYRACSIMNAAARRVGGIAPVEPGHLHLSMVSSHLYETNFEEANKIYNNPDTDRVQPLAPTDLWDGFPRLLTRLKLLRDTKAGDPLRWWERDVHAPKS